MIGFKQFLSESRTFPLYHGTPYRKAISIIESGGFLTNTWQNSFMLLKTRIKASPGTFGGGRMAIPANHTETTEIHGLSTTRNIRFAKLWVTQVLAEGESGVVIFEFDQRKLTHNYQIKPINFYQFRKGDTDESEEFIISNKPIPLKYVTRIYAARYAEIKDLVKKHGHNIQVLPLK